MNDVSTPIMNLLEKVLDVTSQRHKLVVANMANVDTPGYHTKDLDFRSELRLAAGSDEEETFLAGGALGAGASRTARRKQCQPGPRRPFAGGNANAVWPRYSVAAARIPRFVERNQRRSRRSRMSMFSTLEISGSALTAERQRAEVVAANMANAETTHTS
jgi:flagellar basal body rod protein FlgB